MSPRMLLLAHLVTFATAAPSLAQRLPVDIRPDHYDLAFDVDLGRARFEGTETIRVRLSEPARRVVLHALDLDIHEATIASDGASRKAKVALDRAAETATLSVSGKIPAGIATIHLRFAGVLNDKLRGFYLSKTSGRSYAVTQLESTDARRTFPCFDEPAMKATFALALTIARGDTAISNGALLSDTPGPGPSRHTLKFATTPKMSSYLVAMAVGDFQCLEGAADNVPIRVCTTPGKRELGHVALDIAKDVLTFYNRYYEIGYPFGKLDMVAIPDFAAGGMENTAAIFYRETDLLADEQTSSLSTIRNIASVIAHEVAHQWFGDLVTMRWWDDLWLNEGFATWMETRPLTARHPEWNLAVDEALDNQTALDLDALGATRPIHSSAETPAEIEETFDAIAYQKGAAVLRMIENYVGARAFRTGVNAYLARHAYSSATSEDFWAAITTVSGKPIDRILPTFVNQPGVPLVDVSLACQEGGSTLTVRQRRFFLDPAQTNATRTGTTWQIPICVKRPDGADAICIVATDRESNSLALPGCAPWVFVNAGAQGYFRTAYPPEMLRALAPAIETSLTAPERLSLAGDEWALVRAGRHTVADYLTLAAGFGRERQGGVLTELAGRLAFIHDYIATDALRPRFEAFIRTLLRPRFDEMGLVPAHDDSDDLRALRSVVVSVLGTTGNDPDAIAGARSLIERALSGGAALDPTTANAMLRVAASRGDRALFDALVAAAQHARDPEEYDRYLGALTYFEDPPLVQRGLERALTDDIRRRDTAFYLRGFLANRAANALAWTFVKQHWATLLPKMSIAGADAGLVASLGSFCDAGARDDIKSFFKAHRLPSAARALDQTIERINNCITLRETQTPVLAQWLGDRVLSGGFSRPRTPLDDPSR
jgi:aminopeptidase N